MASADGEYGRYPTQGGNKQRAKSQKLIALLLDWRVRRLIVNADDFGLTAGVDRAILEAHRNGVVTSSSLMANGAALGDAIQLAQSAPRLSVGCHVVLVDGSPVTNANQVPSLIHSLDQNFGVARFHRGFADLARRAVLGRVVPEQIEAEVTGQIRKLQASGIAVSHLDSHKHTHLIPQVLGPVLRAAATCGVRRIRNPFEPVRVSLLGQGVRMWKRFAQVKLLGRLAGRFREAVQNAGMLTPDGTFGIVSTGWLDERLFKFLIQHLAEGTWELVCHPGYNDADLREVNTRLRESRERELRLLGLAEARQFLADNGIELISYNQLG